VDIHAETTSEKIAFGWYLDGRVTAVSEHTRTLPPRMNTCCPKDAYITDVGMTGRTTELIGMDVWNYQEVSRRSARALRSGHRRYSMNAVLIETDETAPRNEAGRLAAKSIERLRCAH